MQRLAMINDTVRLTQAIPTLWLKCGEVGVIQSVWKSSPQYYEVEFQRDKSCPLRALLHAGQLEVIGPAPSSN